MFLRERLRQKYRTLDWPARQPALSPRYRGRPLLKDEGCASCAACIDACPTGALARRPEAPERTPTLDMGRCIFCGACESMCPKGAIRFSSDYHLACRRREELLVMPGQEAPPAPELAPARGIFGRSFKLRQVSAGGCNACESDCNVLGTLVYDLGRFGIEFTASPRHADGLALTGPLSRNMLAALLEAWQSVPEPRVLLAVGACAISGGLFRESADCVGGMDGMAGKEWAEKARDAGLAVSVCIPGCPPNPWSILEGILLARQS